MEKQFLTVKETAQLTGLSKSTIRNYLKQGKIQYKQYGAKSVILIPRQQFDEEQERMVNNELSGVPKVTG